MSLFLSHVKKWSIWSFFFCNSELFINPFKCKNSLYKSISDHTQADGRVPRCKLMWIKNFLNFPIFTSRQCLKSPWWGRRMIEKEKESTGWDVNSITFFIYTNATYTDLTNVVNFLFIFHVLLSFLGLIVELYTSWSIFPTFIVGNGRWCNFLQHPLLG